MKFVVQKNKIMIGIVSLGFILFATLAFLVADGKMNFEYNTVSGNVLQDIHLEEHEETYYRKQLSFNDNDLIILHLSNTGIHFVSQNLLDTLGYKNEDLTDKNLFDYIHQDDAPFFAHAILNVLQSDDTEKISIGPVRLKDAQGNFEMYYLETQALTDSHQEKEGIGISVLKVDS